MTRYALVIGIQKYGGSGFKDLKKPVEDAEAIAQILEKQGDFNVERLPKRWIEAEDRYEIAEAFLKGDELGQCIADFFKRVGVNEALIYFSGHGYQFEKMGRKKGYLVTSDCTTSNVASNGVGLDDFNSLIIDPDLCKCRSLVVLLDCCHAGNLLEESLISGALSAFNSGKRSYLLATACRSQEEAYEGKEFSLFTAAVLKALRSPEKDGRVRGSKLNYVIEQELRGSGQEPVVLKSGGEIILVTYSALSQEPLKTSNKKSSADIPFVLPVLDVSTFTGREKELQQLENVLLNSQGSRACSIVGLAGGGGIGKSALAFHFATIHKDDFPDGVIGLRVDGKDVDTIAREFVRECVGELESEDDRDATTLMQEFFAHRRMLLIFDNADDASIKKLRPSGGRCAVIITTRIRTLASSLDISDEGAIDLDPLSLDDALTLLKKILGDERIDAELASAYEIIRLVGNLPLALQIVGAALRKCPRSLADYGSSLQQEKNRLNRLQVRGDSDLNVETSLNLSLELLSKKEKDFFACLSACAEDGFARRTAMAATGCSDEWETDDNLAKLYELSLLNYTKTGEYRFVLHPLVRIYAKNLAIESDVYAIAQERHANFFVERLQDDDLENAVVVAEVAADLEDVLLAAEWMRNQQGESEQGKRTRYKFATKLQPLFERYGHWQKAITLMARFQTWAEQFQDWSTLTRFKLHEARYWSYTGNFEIAIDVLQSARTSLHNIESLDMRREREATLLNVLAGLFQRQGRTEEAIQTFRDEILIDEEIGNNRALAIAYNRLGRLLQSERKLEEAEQVFQRQIAIAETLNNQASISIGLSCLGGVLQQQWKLEEAEQVFQRGIAISENLNDQTSLTIGLNRLGRLLQQQGKLEEAEQVFLRQIAIYETLNDRAQLSIGLNRLGGLLQQQGKLEDLQKYFSEKIKISEALNNQLELIFWLYKLITCLRQQKKFDEAQKILEDVIFLSETNNLQTQVINGFYQLSSLLSQQEKFDEAQKILEHGISISKTNNLLNQAINGFYQLGSLLSQQEKFEEAQKIFEHIICQCETNNLQTQAINGFYQLGSLLFQQEKFEEAQKIFERGISLSEINNQQVQVAQGLSRLGGLLQQQGKFDEALPIVRRCVSIEVEFGSSRGLTRGLTQLSQILKSKREFKEAISTLEYLAQIEKELGNERGVVMILSSLSSLQLENRCFGEASKTLLSLIAIEEKLNNIKRMADILCDLGYVAFQQENFELSVEYYDRSIELSKEASDEEITDSILNRTAVSLHHCGIDLIEKRKNIDKAVEVLERSQEISQQINSISQVGFILHTLGRAWKIKGKLLKSELCLKRSQEIFEDENDLPNLVKVLNTLGGVLEKQQKWDEAEKILRRCYDLARALQDVRGQSVITNSIGQVLARQEDDAKFKLAQMHFGESIKLGIQLDDKHHLAKVYTAMGQALLNRKDFEKAAEQLIKGFEIDESISNKRGLKLVTPDLTYALAQLKKYDEALAYCERSLKIAPNDPDLLQLQRKIETTISGGIQKSSTKLGTILYIRQNEDKSHWGQIKPSDGGLNIYFNEKFINPDCITKLMQGSLVEVEVNEKNGKFYAKNIRIVEEK